MSDSPLAVRRMEPQDKPAILDIASRIWDGGDYLPAVFDEWVADTSGEFVAVLRDGQVVGCAKLTFLTPTDAWLEGLRKDPRVSVRGVGRAASSYLLARLAERTDLTSLRLSTDIRNKPSIVTHEKLGFRLRTAFSVRYWEGSRDELFSRAAGPSSAVSPRVEPQRDEREIRRFLQRRGYFDAADGLMSEGWRVLPYSEPLFVRRYAATGTCHGTRSPEGLTGLYAGKIGRRPRRITMDVVGLDADDDTTAARLIDHAFQALARTVRQEPSSGARCRVQWMIPAGERFRRWCDAAGLAAREQENDLLVFEYPPEELRARRGPGGTP